MRTTDFVRGIWPQVFKYYNLPPITGGRHYNGDCPLCGSKGSFRIDNKNSSGSFICKCSNGSGWDLLIQTTGKDFRTLAREIDQTFGNTYEHQQKAPIVNDKLSQAVSRFREIGRIEGTPAQDYLNKRGIFTMPTGGVKFSQREFNSDIEGYRSAMYAIASNDYHEAIQRHLTYLDGDQKADVPRQKKMLSLQDYQGSVAVKLFEQKSTLGIAEGIETALSASQIYKSPVWSTLNATIMKKFRAPAGVRALLIFADNDKNGTGLAAAFDCGKSNLLCNNDVDRVLIRWPELPDFNDMLISGCKVYEWPLSK